MHFYRLARDAKGFEAPGGNGMQRSASRSPRMRGEGRVGLLDCRQGNGDDARMPLAGTYNRRSRTQRRLPNVISPYQASASVPVLSLSDITP